MLFPRGDFILHRVYGTAILCVFLMSEKNEGTSQLPTSETLVNSTGLHTNKDVHTPVISQQTTESSTVQKEEDEPPVSPDIFSKPCYASIRRYTYHVIVERNMNKSAAAYQHAKRDNFKELARNLSETLMTFVTQMEQLGWMFSPVVQLPVQIGCSEDNSKVPVPVVGESNEKDESVTVPLLLLVILVLISYIGFLSYKIKRKYYRNSNILIEDR